MPPDYTVTNFWALLMLKGLLRQEGFTVGRLHVATLMKTMGIEAIYRRPNTSKPHPEHKIYPYLLRNMAITRPNQVWVMGITYVPPLGDCMQSPAGQRMRRGFVYLAAVIDWFTRKVLAWRVSITLETAFCIEAVEDAMVRFGRPEIFNKDQGSQFTSTDFIKLLKDAEVSISMGGKGAWRDNRMIERFWRSVKYEEIYLHAYTNVPEARAGIGKYIKFYNERRPQSSLAGNTPDQAYFNQPKPIPVAA